MSVRTIAAAAVAACLAGAVPAVAQTPAPAAKPDRTVDLQWGYTVFQVEDSRFEHTRLGGGFRLPVTSRLAIGAEVAHLRGPGEDRDWVLGGLLTFDLLPFRPDAAAPIVPYVIGAGGYLRHADVINDEPIKVNTGIGSAGAGVRIALGRFIVLSPEFRVGLERHWHFGLVIGIKDKRQPRR
jgi:hypothetical protein